MLQDAGMTCIRVEAQICVVHYLLEKVRIVLLLHDLFLLFRVPLLYSMHHRHIDGIFDLTNILTLKRRSYIKVFPAQTGYERLQ